ISWRQLDSLALVALSAGSIEQDGLTEDLGDLGAGRIGEGAGDLPPSNARGLPDLHLDQLMVVQGRVAGAGPRTRRPLPAYLNRGTERMSQGAQEPPLLSGQGHSKASIAPFRSPKYNGCLSMRRVVIENPSDGGFWYWLIKLYLFGLVSIGMVGFYSAVA